MKSITTLGIALTILGALALAYQGFNYTRQRTVIDVGPIHATADDRGHISIPPVVGGLTLVGGVALLIIGARPSK
jgi:hypothetical protein